MKFCFKVTKPASSLKQFRLLPDFINTGIIMICLPLTIVLLSGTSRSQVFSVKVLINENNLAMWKEKTSADVKKALQKV